MTALTLACLDRLDHALVVGALLTRERRRADVVVGEDFDDLPAEPVGQRLALLFLAFDACAVAAVFGYAQVDARAEGSR